MASISRRRLSRTCSQLSNTNSRDRPSNADATDSVTVFPGCWVMPEHRRRGVGYRRGIGDRGQFEKPDPVGEFIGEPRPDFDRQAGLADPTYSGQRHQPM